jgi:peptide/histidine transporter 3/4
VLSTRIRASSSNSPALAAVFNWFYLVINVGSLLAATCVVYIQENISWMVGFAVPTVAMGVAVVCFVLGSGRYRHARRAPGATSPIARALAVVASALGASLLAALRCRCFGAGRRGAATTPLPLSVAEADAAAAEAEAAAALLSESYADAGDTAPLAGSLTPSPGPPRGAPHHGRSPSASASPLAAAAARPPALPRWLLRATREHGGRYTAAQVEEVAMVLALLPVFCTGIVYWMVYAQMGSVFVEQGAQMDRRLGRTGYTVPSASLSSFDTLAVVLLIPLFEKGIYPAFERAGRKLRPLQRTGAGHLLAVAAMLAAAALERKRLAAAARGELLPPSALGIAPPFSAPGGGGGGGDNASQSPPGIVALSVFWQAPQYLLIGASEVLAAVAQLELYYDQAPDSMRSCSMALQLAATACGGYAASALLRAVSRVTEAHSTPWIAQDLNDGRLDLFFLLLAALMVRFVACVCDDAMFPRADVYSRARSWRTSASSCSSRAATRTSACLTAPPPWPPPPPLRRRGARARRARRCAPVGSARPSACPARCAPR